jgi:hypothetical protein
MICHVVEHHGDDAISRLVPELFQAAGRGRGATGSDATIRWAKARALRDRVKKSGRRLGMACRPDEEVSTASASSDLRAFLGPVYSVVIGA